METEPIKVGAYYAEGAQQLKDYWRDKLGYYHKTEIDGHLVWYMQYMPREIETE